MIKIIFIFIFYIYICKNIKNMKRSKLTREDLISRIEEKYTGNPEKISSFLEPEFIIDMYINGYNGIKNSTDQELMDMFDIDFNPASIDSIGSGWFEVEFDDEDDYDNIEDW